MVSVRDNVPFPYRIRTEDRLEKNLLGKLVVGGLISALPKLLPRIASFVATRGPAIAPKVATVAPRIAQTVATRAPVLAEGVTKVAKNPLFRHATDLIGPHIALNAILDNNSNNEDDENNKSFAYGNNTMRKSEDIMPYDINKVVSAQIIRESELDNLGGGSLSIVFYEKRNNGKKRKIKKSVSEMSTCEFYELMNKAEIPTRQAVMSEGARAGNIPTELVLGGVLGGHDPNEGWFDKKDEHGTDLATRIVGNSKPYLRPRLDPVTGKPKKAINPATKKPYGKNHPRYGEIEQEVVAPSGISPHVSRAVSAAATRFPQIGNAFNSIIKQASKFIP